MVTKKHKFKTIHSKENVYRIIDLTDTRIVGVIECYSSFDKAEREKKAARNKEIKEGSVFGAKVTGYGVFIILDEDNSDDEDNRILDDEYLYGIMKQMALYFRLTEIDNNPSEFANYELPKRAPTTKSRQRSSAIVSNEVKETIEPSFDEERKANKVVLFIVKGALIIGLALLLTFLWSSYILPLIIALLIIIAFI